MVYHEYNTSNKYVFKALFGGYIMSLSHTLYGLRKKSNLTLRQAAGKIGVSHSYISILEKDKNNTRPSYTVLKAISDVYNYPLDGLLTLADGRDAENSGLISFDTYITPPEDLLKAKPYPLSRIEVIELIERHQFEVTRLLEYLKHMDK